MALITVTQLEARLNSTVNAEQAQATIEDASGIVTDYVADTDITDNWDPTTTPAAVRSVVVQMVQRGLENPLGLTGENLGDHGWQANPRVGVGPYLAPSEKKIIRRATGKVMLGTIGLESDLPLPPVLDNDLIL